MTVKNLSTTSFNIIMDCFLQAFKNYFVQMPTEKSFYQKRWESAGVDFRFSYGMFDGEELVGFIIHAVDDRNGKYIAFNTGTGVLPNYRGQKIIKKIYENALPDLKNNGFSKCSLEVICENKVAIKSYESIGFVICKNYLCFSGELELKLDKNITLKETNYTDIDWESIPNQKNYSWDNQKETLLISDYRYYQVYHKNTLVAFFAIDSTTGYVPQFEVLVPANNSWKQLFKGMQEVSKKIKINNVDDRLNDKIHFLQTLGLKNTINQYEMELSL